MGIRPRLGFSVKMPHHEAADIGADMQRSVAGRRRGAGARRGAARILAEVPGVARQRMEARQARGEHAVIRHGGLAEDDGAGLADARGWRCVGGGGGMVGGHGAERHRHAFGRDILLDGDRHAVERTFRLSMPPARLRFGCARKRPFRIEAIGRLEMRFPALDMVEHGARHLDGRQRFRPIAGEKVKGGKLVKRHGSKARI
jgi:hypothetical protein